MKPKRRTTLTEQEWREVFRARVKSKQGQALTPEERSLVDDAWRIDEARYSAMGGDVFDATVPFGSSARFGKR